MIVWGGEKTHLVHYPLRRGELFNLVAVFHSDRYEEGWDTFGDPAELHERFADKCEPVRTLLQEGQRLEDVGAVRPPADQELDQGPHHAARRRRASDAAVSRAGRQHGDGGRGLPRQPGRGDARRLRGGVQEIPGAALSAHRARAAHGARVRRDLSRQRRQPRTAQQDAARLDRGKAASTCRGSTAISRSCRTSTTSRCRSRRESDSSNNNQHIREETLDGETRRPDRRPRHREPHAGQATASSIRSATSASAIRTIRTATSCRARARPSASRRDDIMEFTLECDPVDAKGRKPYSSASSTARAYEARPDVMSRDPQPQPGRDPVRRHRPQDAADHAHVRHHRPRGADLGPAQEVRRHRPAGPHHGDGPRPRQEARQGRAPA